ncbi:ABC transporter ATP-binding protein [Microtetraspora malaysiensis]|uniref:ABC transporter ATP-binding protein n=1 Tax=Microtetraspora malaysiensis TaxID=161358 RepID=UPI00082F9D6E|nr:ABC transporter ATP-binding protein [Microtetraspora malaysiensis]
MNAVEVENLTKKYPGAPQSAVDSLSFQVSSGEVFGVLGPNGAGKTTTVGVLTTRMRPTGGLARVGGVDVAKEPTRVRRLLGVVPQRNNLDRSLSIRQNLLFHAAYHGVRRAERRQRAAELLERMGLAERGDDRLDNVSGGQAQRVMIARALMHEPQVLFLDEPSTGLDPQSRIFVHECVRELKDRGVTVVLTTHQMDEAAKLCDRVAIVDRGKLLALDAPAALVRELPGSTTLTLSLEFAESAESAAEDVNAALTAVETVERVEAMPGGRVRLYTSREPGEILPAVLKALAGHGISLTGLDVAQLGLEDVFLRLTGRELR